MTILDDINTLEPFIIYWQVANNFPVAVSNFPPAVSGMTRLSASSLGVIFCF